ncbi:transcriptional regulator, GntR family [Alteribacillus persepolensis]|uniref:Transcriptional regulator, GntR family n=1 Tax=Alteribacillus persepolensis TaxID=568899 RepID=A0A1G8GVM6_9BACI|nr:GntR family transcriptional regulator [Alteribacillus persepolensis]SDH98448.1 transcriptional regulator, GntR family [Alteribacillus persepolensis]
MYNKETQIIDEIMQLMVNKALTSGQKLPSENALAKKHNVPRMTVRNALTTLEERGYIYSVQGKGRFVKEKSMQIELHLTGKKSFTDKMEQLGYDLTTKNICCEKINYDEKMYRRLQADKDDSVYKIGRLRWIDDEPMAIHYSFVHAARFPSIAGDGPNITSMFAYYRKQGYHDFTSQKNVLSVTFPTEYEQKLLSCKRMVPLILVESDCLDADSKQVLEHTKILYRSDTFKYDISMDA